VPLGSDYSKQPCPLARALELVGERWTLLILRDLFMGVHRFSDLQGHLDIPRAVLSARLAELHLTDGGRELWPVLYGLMEWGDRRSPAPGGPRRVFVHADCGTRLDADGECPTCELTPDVADVEMRSGPGRDPARRDDPVSRALRKPHRLLTPLTV
jgi:DNA-binding HxlR family transcriptional regulator